MTNPMLRLIKYVVVKVSPIIFGILFMYAIANASQYERSLIAILFVLFDIGVIVVITTNHLVRKYREFVEEEK